MASSGPYRRAGCSSAHSTRAVMSAYKHLIGSGGSLRDDFNDGHLPTASGRLALA